MPRFTQNDAECRVYTFKEGLLSAIAHDLEIAVDRFHVEWDDARTRVEARFDATSLRVVHAMKDGTPSPSALSDRDKKKIESNIQGEVLETKRHADVVFTSSTIEPQGEGFVIRGALELHGRKRDLQVRVTKEGAKWVASATLHQPDFGITPYTAMMGTLRIQPDVRVRVSAPA